MIFSNLIMNKSIPFCDWKLHNAVQKSNKTIHISVQHNIQHLVRRLLGVLNINVTKMLTVIIHLVRSGCQWSTAHLSQSVCPHPFQVQGSMHELGSPLPHQRESCLHGNLRQRRSWCQAPYGAHIWSPGKGFHQRSVESHSPRLWMPAGWLRMSYTLRSLECNSGCCNMKERRKWGTYISQVSSKTSLFWFISNKIS